MNIAPPVFETTTLARSVTNRIYTGITSVTGSYTYLDLTADASDSATRTENFTWLKSEAVDISGHQTFVETFSPWDQYRGGNDGGAAWRWGLGVGDEVFGKTVHINISGTTETRSFVSVLYDDNDEFPDRITAAQTIEKNEPELQTSTQLNSWQTTTYPTQIITTTETATQELVWTTTTPTQTDVAVSWTQTQRPATSQGTTLTNGTSEGTSLSGITITLNTEQSLTKVITCSEAFGNTLILAQGSNVVQYALTTTETAQPQEPLVTTTIFGEATWIEEPVLLATFAPNPPTNFELTNGVAGYATQLTTTTEALTVSWTRTRTSNVTNAGILTASNSAPRATVGQVMTSSARSPILTIGNITTTEVEETVMTHGTTTTSVVVNKTSNYGPAQVSFTNTTVFTIETFIPPPTASQIVNADFIEGFSIATTGTFTDSVWGSLLVHHASVTWITPKIEILPRLGVTSSSASLQTQRINTLSFGVFAGGQDGTSYANTSFLTNAPTRTLLFAPKSAQEFLPISGSGSGSTFTFSYYGDKISQTYTVQSGDVTSTTSTTQSWSVNGSAQSYWVDVSRNSVSGSPAAPTTIPALIVGGTGQAFLPRGLYETYSGGVTGATSGSQQFADGGSVSVFEATEGVTAVKPIPYFTTYEGTGTSIETTAVSYRNNLTAQPIDD